MKQHSQIIILIVENQSGVLNRVTTLLRRRNFNIDSLTVATTENKNFSRMTIALEKGSDAEQVTKQLHKLVNVIKVWQLPHSDMILHESIFLKVCATKSNRSEVLQFAEAFQAVIVDIAEKSITFQYSSAPEKISNFIDLMKPFGIKELVQSGSMAIAKDLK